MIQLMLLSAHNNTIHVYVVSAKYQHSTQESALDMKECVAYEVNSLAKRKVHMETNPAYEQVGMNH